jgi:hypothetical protein
VADRGAYFDNGSAFGRGCFRFVSGERLLRPRAERREPSLDDRSAEVESRACSARTAAI